MTKTKYIIFALFAFCGIAVSVSESANAQIARAVCPAPGIDTQNAIRICSSVDGSGIAVTTSYGENAPNVQAVFVLVRVNQLSATDSTQLLAIANRTADDIVYSPTSDLVFYPEDARYRPLTLSALSAETTIPAMMQQVLVFNVANADFGAPGDGLALYNSMPTTALTCGDGMLNDRDNGCIPPTEEVCGAKTPPEMLMGEVCVPIPDPNCDEASAELMGGVCVCKEGFEDLDDMQDPQICEMIPDGGDGEMPGDNTGGGGGGGGMTPTVTMTTEASAKKDGVSFGGVVGIGAVAFLAILISRGGEEGEFGFSPKYGYSLTESGYSANVGGRMDFRKDEWTLFYTGGQTNANGEFGDFRYASGGEYKTDFWQASFSESVQGERADYDLSLSADLQGGMWSLSPVYRIHSRLEEGETETRNSLNLEGVLRYEDWRITPSAGFGWRRMENFGDSAKFRLEAVREF